MAGMWLFADKQQELHKYTVLGCVESGLRYPSIYGLKALVSGCKTKGFRMRNQGFQDVKPRVLGCKTHGFANEKYQLLKVKEKKTKIEAIVIILTNVL